MLTAARRELAAAGVAKLPEVAVADAGYDFMRAVLSTEHGNELYRQRAQLIEPIFGNTKRRPARHKARAADSARQPRVNATANVADRLLRR
jgi:hypothetical protein